MSLNLAGLIGIAQMIGFAGLVIWSDRQRKSQDWDLPTEPTGLDFKEVDA